jgi:hypothetical protein
MTGAELIRSYLDRMVERRVWSTPVRPLTVAGAQEILRHLIRQDGLRTPKVRSAYDGFIEQYLDNHDAFERVSDSPAWVLKVKRHPASGG